MKPAIVTLLEIVAMLFAAFGSFLLAVAPPGTNGLGMPSGLAAFSVLVIFAVVKLAMAARKPQRPKRMIVFLSAACGMLFIALGLFYFAQMSTYAFRFPAGDPDAVLLVAGEELTEGARELVRRKPHLAGDHAALLATVGYIDMNLIWPRPSVVQKQTELTQIYVAMVSALALCLGFAIEGSLRTMPRAGGGGAASASPAEERNTSPSRGPRPSHPPPMRSTPRR